MTKCLTKLPRLRDEFEAIIAMARSSGFQEGITYDKIVMTSISTTEKLLRYTEEDICKFEISVTIDNDGGFTLQKSDCEFFLLQENGDFVLQENGDKLKVHGLIPFIP